MAALGAFDQPPAAAVTPTPGAEPPVAAFFGSSADPLCEGLFDDMEELCRREGWRLISYDCKGKPVSQKGQTEDLLRTETADVAVIWPVLEAEELDEAIEPLAKQCPVVAVGKRPEGKAARLIAAYVGEDEQEQLAALAEYLQAGQDNVQGALLLTDIPDKPLEARYQRELSALHVEVLGNNYTWTGAVYARRYLITALDDIPGVDAVICTSRPGTEGTWNTLREKELRDKVLIVRLGWDQRVEDDLAVGALDAAVTVSPEELARRLGEVLPKALKGEKPGAVTLTPVLLAP